MFIFTEGREDDVVPVAHRRRSAVVFLRDDPCAVLSGLGLCTR